MRRLIQNLFSATGANQTPRAETQTRPLRGRHQVQNGAGGYVFEVDPWQRLDRFLILGSEGGTFYVSERDLSIDSAQAVIDCLALDAERTVRQIVEISVAGRAHSNRPALFALAIAFCEPTAVPIARSVFTDVVRTGTHLFEFLTAVRALRGFGRALRGAVSDWYLSRSLDDLAYQLVKYRQRSGWSHRDVLRLAHPQDAERDGLFRWAVGKEAEDLPDIVRGFIAAQSAPLAELPGLVRRYSLTHEMVPNVALRDPYVLTALVESMPMGALVRFLGRLGAAGLLEGPGPVMRAVTSRLKDRDLVRRSRLHPMQILTALRTYSSGCGVQGKLRWPVDSRVVGALDSAFESSFDNVVPSGRRMLVAVDVSGSMGWSFCSGSHVLTCAEGAAALALITARTEQGTLLKAFSHELVDLPINPHGGVDRAVRAAANMSFGATDCALPMLWALENRAVVETFVILTDNETWYGNVHPCEALRRYREATGIQAKLVVVAMTGTAFTIADPADPHSLDVVGFDTATPGLIADFAAGRI